ncbi:hypothetical protein A6R68_00458 [Neotoma lepida]|uniref:Uncharacterized protein n=1 Tax=Neotoma lepida TaxID=56216 RepID=A0A1A6GXR8_NEOLE|nr:hypothetical protein A6R68_00458 [Neotoma lepida]
MAECAASAAALPYVSPRVEVQRVRPVLCPVPSPSTMPGSAPSLHQIWHPETPPHSGTPGPCSVLGTRMCSFWLKQGSLVFCFFHHIIDTFIQ